MNLIPCNRREISSATSASSKAKRASELVDELEDYEEDEDEEHNAAMGNGFFDLPCS
jgi:ribosomal protein L12E/L44/L45/RPP1/RPP2